MPRLPLSAPVPMQAIMLGKERGWEAGTGGLGLRLRAALACLQDQPLAC